MATTTPNFGWAVPTSTDLVKDGAVAIETLGDSIDASLVDLKGGTTGQVLAKASNTDMDFTWATSSVGSWTAWTATLGNITLGNGTVVSRYQQIGKTVNFRFSLTLGTTTSITGSAYFFLPVAPSYDTPCTIMVRDNGVAFYPTVGMVFSGSGGYCDITVGNASTTYLQQANVSGTIPVTLGSTDVLYVSGTYEVA